MENNIVVTNNNSITASLAGSTDVFCSFKVETNEDKARLFAATNNPDYRLADCINKVIYVKDIYAESVECTNEETGEGSVCPRVVLIDKDNKSYQCVSVGIFSAVKKLIGIYGAPTWEEPIPIEVKQLTKGKKKMLSLNIVS